MLKLLKREIPKGITTLFVAGLSACIATFVFELMFTSVLVRSDLGDIVAYAMITSFITAGHPILLYVFCAMLVSYVILRTLKASHPFTTAFLAGGISSVLTVLLRPENGDLIGSPNYYLALLIPAIYVLAGKLVQFFATSKNNIKIFTLFVALPLYIIAPFADIISASISDGFDSSRERQDTNELRKAIYKSFVPYGPSPNLKNVDEVSILADAYYYEDNTKVSDSPEGIEISVIVDFKQRGEHIVLGQSAKFATLPNYVQLPNKCKLNSLNGAMNELRKYATSTEVIDLEQKTTVCRKLGTTSNNRTVWTIEENEPNITRAYLEIDNTIVLIMYRNMDSAQDRNERVLDIVKSLVPLKESSIKPSFDFAPYHVKAD